MSAPPTYPAYTAETRDGARTLACLLCPTISGRGAEIETRLHTGTADRELSWVVTISNDICVAPNRVERLSYSIIVQRAP